RGLVVESWSGEGPCRMSTKPGASFGAVVAPLFHQLIGSFVSASRTGKAICPTARATDTAGKPPRWRSPTKPLICNELESAEFRGIYGIGVIRFGTSGLTRKRSFRSSRLENQPVEPCGFLAHSIIYSTC